MPVRRHPEAGDDGSSLGERIFPAEFVVVAMQIIDVLRDHDVLKVLPRTAADAVAGVDRPALERGIAAEIGAPGFAAGADVRCQRLAVAIGALKPAEIAALARSDAGDE